MQRSTGEAICLRYLNQRFRPHLFRKIRPVALVNPLTGRRLELDMYNGPLKIAVEYNGSQHTVYPNYLSMTGKQTREEFDRLQARDKFKSDYCRQNGIKLIVVPHTVRLKDIPAFLAANLR